MPLKILTQVQPSRTPKSNSLLKNTLYDVQIVKIGPLVFAQLTLLFNPPNPTLYNAFQSARHLKSAPSRGASTSHVIDVPWTHPTQHPKLHLDRFSRFCTAHDRESTYNVC